MSTRWAAVAGVKLEQGRVRFLNRKRFDGQIRRFPDGDYTMTLERAVATRSLPQNAYYWAVVVPRVFEALRDGSIACVNSTKDTHDVLKALHLPHDLAARGRNGTLINGLVLGGSTKALGVLEFIDYLDAIVLWAGETLRIEIPPPDPEWRQHALDEITRKAGRHAAA